MAARKKQQSSQQGGIQAVKAPAASREAGSAPVDSAASAALAEAVASARQGLKPAKPPEATRPVGNLGETAAESAPALRGSGARIAAQAALALAMVAAGWSAAYVGTLANQQAFGRMEAEIVRSQEILARLTGDLEALKGTVASFRDVEQTASVTKASDQARLAEKVERLAIAVQDPGKKFAAVESRLDRMEGQILANLASLAAKPPAPPPAPAAPAAPAASAPAPAPSEAALRDPAPAVKPAKSEREPGRNEPLDGWTLREVYDGAALIESQNRRLYEVMPGGFIPGLGRVEAIERRGRNWVVLTDKGTIATR